MALRLPWSTRCSTASTPEQIVSALELKLRAVKEDFNEYWSLHAEFAGTAVAKRKDCTL